MDIYMKTIGQIITFFSYITGFLISFAAPYLAIFDESIKYIAGLIGLISGVTYIVLISRRNKVAKLETEKLELEILQLKKSAE